MQNQLNELQENVVKEISGCADSRDVEQVRTKYLGKKGLLTDVLKGLGRLPVEERPKMGQIVNVVKKNLAGVFEDKLRVLAELELENSLQNVDIDVSLPGKKVGLGKKHPLNIVCDEIVAIFGRLGFSVAEGPDVENDYYNFEALNIPDDHPARDMHDTFYLNDGSLLRTHTSPVQIRMMETHKPPLKILVPGKVYRCDADITHSAMFQQVEGLYVNKDVSFSDLKGTLEFFLHELFGKDKKVRFRPSYFPFTEPSAEVDVQCVQCSGAGCNVCKQTGWLEILGCGMVNKKVFKSVGYDPEEITGFAFGMGVERIAMLKYAINDIRLFYENDLRFLEQF